MHMYQMLNRVRYIKPLERIENNWITASFVGVMASVGDFLLNIFHTNIEMIFLLLLAILIDLGTGIYSSKRRKNPIKSLGLRQTVVKIIEYTAILGILIGVSNVYGKHPTIFSEFVSYFDIFAFFFLTWIEIKSIVENLSDKDGNIKELIEKAQENLDTE